MYAQRISRRDFLKLTSLALAGAFLPAKTQTPSSLSGQLGRVIYPEIAVYKTPSFESEKVKVHWKDTVFSITNVTIGEDKEHHNRVWYQIKDEGYVHSGGVQPVRIQLNTSVVDLPPEGALTEVTVPYTDAHWNPGKQYAVAYRFYYQTTHWVSERITNEQGSTWYKIFDDKWEFSYYVPAEHLRLVPEHEIRPISPDVPDKFKRLEVHTYQQYVVAYEYDQPVFMTRAATGAKFSNGNFGTPGGRHWVFHKRPSRHMAAGNLAANGFDLPGVPWVSYFTERGVAFHGTYWHNDYGKPRSHGCVNLSPQAAKWIYRWTQPHVPFEQPRAYEKFGTTVDVL